MMVGPCLEFLYARNVNSNLILLMAELLLVRAVTLLLFQVAGSQNARNAGWNFR